SRRRHTRSKRDWSQDVCSSDLTFPREMLEAASIDGASRWRILWRVVYPISRPTLAVLLIFFFIWTWNEFLIPLTFLISTQNQTRSEERRVGREDRCR